MGNGLLNPIRQIAAATNIVLATENMQHYYREYATLFTSITLKGAKQIKESVKSTYRTVSITL